MGPKKDSKQRLWKAVLKSKGGYVILGQWYLYHLGLWVKVHSQEKKTGEGYTWYQNIC